MFYPILFLVFLYFKIARVHKKEERVSSAQTFYHTIAALSAAALLVYGFMYENGYLVAAFSFLFFIIASLTVTAVQLGIFVNGKPMLGLTRLYRYLPLFSFSIALAVCAGWALRIL